MSSNRLKKGRFTFHTLRQIKTAILITSGMSGAFCDYFFFGIRTVTSEYLVAMKLVSGRQYKKDLSDIAGIVYEQPMAGKPLTYEMIDVAVRNLYGSWDNVADQALGLLERILACEDLSALFVELSEDERAARAALAEMVKRYPAAIKQDNVNDVIAAVMRKKRQAEE